jgi:hypothetical protein
MAHTSTHRAHCCLPLSPSFLIFFFLLSLCLSLLFSIVGKPVPTARTLGRHREIRRKPEVRDMDPQDKPRAGKELLGNFREEKLLLGRVTGMAL